MAKRMHDTTIWKNQRWFKKLSPQHKLAFLYIKDQCDHAGFWKVDFAELIDDLGFDEFDIKKFIADCNKDFDKFTGKPVERDRVKLLENSSYLWITGFIKFQYDTKEFVLNPSIPVVKSAIEILFSHKTLSEALLKGYITLPEAYSKAMERAKDKDKDKDKDIFSIVFNTLTTSKSERLYKQEGKPIQINGTEHQAKKNGIGWVYPSIIGKKFNKEKTEVLLLDETWQKLSTMQHNLAVTGKIKPEEIFKGKIK